MATNYSTSVNIIRDANRDLLYLPTPNALQLANQLGNDFKKGLRSFNIIGSYGTGKSSFLWAFEQSLVGKKPYFKLNWLNEPTASFINFIGEYKSITEVFANYFGVADDKYQTQHILSEIFNRYHDLGEQKPFLVLVIDEFGKFLEYAAQHEPERELYFIQQLTEFVNNSDHNICLLTTVHQNFDAYAFTLNQTQRQEWSKVKGRFREITFNEPVEQLLYLASEHLNSNPNKQEMGRIQKSLQVAQLTKTFKFEQAFAEKIASKLFPLELLAANALMLSLQKYGQNERSLFSFLESTDHTGLDRFTPSGSNPFYNIANVYDYLIFNFYSFLNSKNNPDLMIWAGIRASLENVERLFDEKLGSYEKLVKTIGLLSFTTPKGAVIDKVFLMSYAQRCLGIDDADLLIDDLERRKIIIYRKFNTRYILFEGTDLDIQLALNEASNLVSEINDVVRSLAKYLDLSPVIAKMYNLRSGTPRMFEYRISENPIDITPIEETDGFINLIFNDQLPLERVKEISANHEEAIIYGYYQNARKIKDQLFEIEKTNKVLTDNSEDKVAVRELESVLFHHKKLLNNYLTERTFSGEVIWIFKGEEIQITNERDFNKYLSQICMKVYTQTPSFRNELVNKHRLSNTIITAKKEYIRRLVDNWHLPELGFDAERFPPEKTIYITLLKENGVQLYDEIADFSDEIASGSSFRPLWDKCITFLEKSKKSKLPLSELLEELSQRPFKLKQGLIDFWIPTFLFLKRNDFALFSDEYGYVPTLSPDVFEMIGKVPHKYQIKAFDLEGVRLDLFNSYRGLMNLNEQLRFDNQAFVETIKPLLVFYIKLPEYSKNTQRLHRETIAIRESIAKSKDPEETFFKDFPTALGYSIDSLQRSAENLANYADRLQEAIRELRTCHDELINRFEKMILEDCIGKDMPFESYQVMLQKRFKKLKKHLLLSSQNTFTQRIDSDIDDSKAWLNGIAQALVGRGFDKFKDEDEILLHDRFRQMILDLDSLTNLSSVEINTEQEEAIGLEFTSFAAGIQKNLVRLPKNKLEKALILESEVQRTLSKDKSLNIVVLTNILKKLLSQ